MQCVILAIDPGYDRMGWAIGTTSLKLGGIKPVELIEYGYLQTDKQDSHEARYLTIFNYVEQLIKEYKPTELALETLFFSRNQTTAMKVAEIRGITIIACLKAGLTIHQYNPGTVKLTVTGHGKADKKAIEKMVRLEFKLIDEKIMDDALDAIAILLTHVSQGKLQTSISKPADKIQDAVREAVKPQRNKLQMAIEKAKRK